MKKVDKIQSSFRHIIKHCDSGIFTAEQNYGLMVVLQHVFYVKAINSIHTKNDVVKIKYLKYLNRLQKAVEACVEKIYNQAEEVDGELKISNQIKISMHWKHRRMIKKFCLMTISAHKGWNTSQQAKIRSYADELIKFSMWSRDDGEGLFKYLSPERKINELQFWGLDLK